MGEFGGDETDDEDDHVLGSREPSTDEADKIVPGTKEHIEQVADRVAEVGDDELATEVRDLVHHHHASKLEESFGQTGHEVRFIDLEEGQSSHLDSRVFVLFFSFSAIQSLSLAYGTLDLLAVLLVARRNLVLRSRLPADERPFLGGSDP